MQLLFSAEEFHFSAIEAARMYHQGFASTKWLTQGAPDESELELVRLGITRTPEYVYSEEVLKQTGVPSTAIRILPQPVRNTAEPAASCAVERFYPFNLRDFRQLAQPGLQDKICAP
jgi:hypothetical protein